MAGVQRADPTILPTMEAPPDYDGHQTSQMLADTADTVSEGRVELNLDSKIAQVLAKLVEIPDEADPLEQLPTYSEKEPWNIPLNIVMHVVGSRGDVQPFIALGAQLQKSGHRVRLATHNVFKQFVQSHGIEFYPIGGDPSELMAYMVKNPGLIPAMKTLREGEIQKKRKMIREMLRGCWKSCIEPDPDTNIPFVANAIIANPPSFAHMHCAQALSVPLHMVFTMPWSPTRAFPHPLANIRGSSTDPKLQNYLSYGLVSLMTWQGLGGDINDFRKDIDLEPLPMTEAPFLLETLNVPYTYCWSPALVPKPRDWPDTIDVCGFMFRDAPDYTPPPELAAFLESGEKPVYIGFGSIVADDPEALLKIVLEAVQAAGVRAIVSKGWSDFDSASAPPNVMFLGDCPHEWLFKQVAAVVHHGGAGTTAAGLLNGRPTCIVPFFGDQPFWGEMVATAGAGPSPIHHKKLNSSNLAEALQFCLTPEAEQAAKDIAAKMHKENGVEAAAASFHRHLVTESLRCDINPVAPAVYQYSKKKVSMRLSGSVAEALIRQEKIKVKDLEVFKPKPIFVENRRWDPVTGTTSVTLAMTWDILDATNGLWYGPYKSYKRSKEARAMEKDDDAASVSSSKIRGTMNKDGVKAFGASAYNFGKIWGVMTKGLMVDTTLALSEGLRSTPKLYGEKVKDHEPITDWQSGLKVAGKDGAIQLGTGLVDLFVQPYKGAKENGWLGFAAGVGKGSIGTLTKTGSSLVGLVAYPSQGIWKSMYATWNACTGKAIMRARRVHDIHFAGTAEGKVDEQEVVRLFELRKSGGSETSLSLRPSQAS